MSQDATLAQASARKRELLARLLQERGLAGKDGVGRRADLDRWPLSFAQQRLWFLDQLEPDSPRYNVFFSFRLDGRLDAAALERALTELLRRHEALRARIVDVEGRPEQIVVPAEACPLAVHDLTAFADDARETEVARRAWEEARRPFRLAEGPLFRAVLLRLAGDRHVLLLSMHHVASDAWSVGILSRELWTLYEAFAQGRPSPLPEPVLQYADFAAWQERWLSGTVLETQLGYWRERLAGVPPLELPTDRPRREVPSFAGAWQVRALPDGLLERLKVLSQSEGATLFMTLLAGYATVLGRWSGQEDVAVGSPIANRGRRELEAISGFFANTLVLRTDLSGAPTFRELLGRVRETCLGAYAHQDLPFERLVEELRPERQLNRNPLFQVSLVLQNALPLTFQPAGLVVTPGGGIDNQVSKFDLTLHLHDGGGGQIAAEYSTDLFDAATAARLLGQLETLLEAASRRPETPVADLPLVDPEEERRALAAWNGTEVDLAPPAALHEGFEAQASRTPDAPAVVFEGGGLSYAELDRRANRLARHLRAAGIGPEARIGVFLERSLELPTALLGILKAGAAWVPLDPSYPLDRLSFMIADAGLSLVLTVEDLAPALPPTHVPVLHLDTDAREIEAQPAERLHLSAATDGLAYVMYTSGSTGQPKGVMVSHRAILNHLLWAQRVYRLTRSDRILQKTTPNFDASVWECFAPLLCGGVLVLARPGGHKDAAYLAATMQAEGVTCLKVVPSLLRALVDEPAFAACASLRLILCGGEALPGELARRAAALLPKVSVNNLYGPTEAAVDVTSWPVGDADAVTVPIGRPTDNVRAYVLDPRGHPVPVGIPGELYVGGLNLARGYWGRGDLTAAAFVPDPFSTVPGARLYRTGDVVRRDAAGVLHFLGRTDHQVKIRGYRIELAEIEAALLSAPGIAAAVASVQAGPGGEPWLVAHVVGEVSPAALRAHLAARLPEYMIPAAFVALPALPLGPTGKIDRRALPKAEAPLAAGGRGPLRTPTEEILAGLWCRLLEIDAVGADDDFFALGGHSLLATRLVSQVRKAFAVELPLRALFEAPTVRGLAARVEAARESGAGRLPSIRLADRTTPLPLSFAQERLYFVDQLAGSSQYHTAIAWRIGGALNVSGLEQALQAMVARHESLRTRFERVAGTPRQVVEETVALALGRIDLTATPASGREAEARRRAGEELHRPFDLGRAPLLRATLMRLAEDDHALVVVLHHIVSDGWSMGVLRRELGEAYAAAVRGGVPSLAPLPIQYADYAAWQRRWLSGDVLESQLAYWRRQLAGLEPLELPTDGRRSREPGQSGAAEWISLPPELAAAVRGRAREEGATLFMVLLAAFQALLGGWTSQEDVAVGVPIAGRNQEELEGLIGFFVNSLVLRTDLSGDPTFREVVQRVKAVTLGAYDHPDMPFDRLVDELAPDRDLARNPLFQAMFVLQEAVPDAPALPGLDVRPLGVEITATRLDLELHVREWEGGLAAGVTYRTDLFTAETAQRLLTHYRRLLEVLARRPDIRLSEAVVLDPAETERLIVDWNTTATSYPRDASLAGLVARRGAERPDAPAVSCGTQTVTYRELDERANRLAAALARQGVGPEVRVGLCTARSVDMVVAMLAIAKAGGAYVPLDPEYPAERLAFMVGDARLKLIVADSSLASSLPETRVPVLRLDLEADALARGAASPVDGGAAADNLCYVIYTSGSTGVPKGVAVSQRAVVRLICDTDYARLGPDDVVIQASNASFDAATFEIWGALLSGARLHIVERDVTLSPSALAAEIRGEKATTLFLTTALFNQVARERPEAFAPLRTLLFGGEAVDPSCVAAVLRAGAPGRLLHVYGPTENTTYSTWHPVAEVGAGDATVPIGLPIGNSTAYVLDKALRPVPVGVPGELYVGGDGLARGYLDRPEATAERFVPHPFAAQPGERLYRTGDRVRRRTDGAIEFLGRFDHQVKLRGFRIELGEIETALRRHPAVHDSIVVAEGADATRRLVAYVTTRPGQAVAASDVRRWVKGELPAYMVPASVVVLDDLPLNANGKVDRRALPAPPAESDEAYEAPRTAVEETLAGVFAAVLRVPVVGVHDNFFDLGGDSIVSLQIVARAAEAGLAVTPRQIFEHQSIAELARVATAAVASADEGDVPAGPVPLTPVQRWFFDEAVREPHHFNQAVLLQLRREVTPSDLEAALGALQSHHDALRMRFTRDGAGTWRQECLADGGGVALERVAIGGAGEAERRAVIAETAERAQRSLDFERGPIWRAVLLDGGGVVPSRLLLVVHHLVVDGVSWRVLLEDLAACAPGGNGRRAVLPPKTASFRRWAERLEAYASQEALGATEAYWRSVETATASIPRDREGAATNRAGDAESVRLTLDPETTGRLLRDVPRAYRTQIADVLLTALALAFRGWTGRDEVVLDLEGHGREDVLGVDVCRTVGWFTAIHPVRLRIAGNDLGAALKGVKEQLRAVPQRGLGYGLLRHLRGASLSGRREVVFNYLGQFDATGSEDAWFGPAPEAAGPTRSPHGHRAHLLEIGGLVSGGCLRLDWTYAPAVHDRATIEALAARFEEALRALVAHGTSGVRGLTPSDVPLVAVDQAALDRIVGESRSVEDVYPLTPMQAGLLSFTLRDPEQGLYHEQGAYEFDGPLDVEALRRAWATVVSRHGILRTRFFWHGLDEPVQVVEGDVDLPWTAEDWSALAGEEQEARFGARRREDRARGFDLGRAPVMRLHLVRLAPERHRLLWSFHHALLDGWCIPLVLRDLLELYRRPEVALPDAPPYRAYVAWLRGQDRAAAERYWRERLGGYEPAPPLGSPIRGTAPGETGEHAFVVAGEAAAALRAAGRRHGLTQNTLVQGAWAVVLSRHAGRPDVAFGVTGSGRPPALPGVDRMVGLFINTLPLRTEVDPSRPAAVWLRRLQAGQLEQRQYEYAALSDVQRWAGLPAGTALFDSLLAFENYPIDPSLLERARELRVRSLGIRETTNVPMVVVAAARGDVLHFRFHYDRRRFDEAAARRFEEHLRLALSGLVAGAERPLGELRLLDAEEERRVVTAWNATATGYPREATLGRLFAEQAAAHAGSVAVSAGSESVTYAELERRSNRLAAYLKERGVGPEVRVGLCAERSIEMVTAMLGIVKAGGAYVPLDPSYPAERLAFMAQDAGLGVVVGQGSLVSGLPPLGVPVCALDGEDGAIQSFPEGPVESGVTADGLAYVIYTSGSTGTPKGVAVPQRAVVRLVRETDYVSLGPADVVLQASNASFDAATFEVWGALLNGARLRIVTREVALSPSGLAAEIREQGATTLFLTTALFNQVAQEKPEAFAPLRTLLFGGEAVDPRWVGEVLRRGTPARLLHVYGPTENTTFSTWEPVTAVDEGAWTVPIGRPIASSRMLVLDSDGRPVPLGVPGELYVGGDGLARGYLGRPERTAERFVPDAHGAEPGARLYRTGDRVRQREDGSVEFLGRLDGQVKIRGFRIELGEVESALLAQPGVRDAVAVVRDDAGNRRLIAYIVADGEAVDGASLRERLKAERPAYLVPSAIVVLDALPLNANGKVDRRALPAPPTDGGGTYEAPRTETERTLVRVFSEVLRVKVVGIRDNFFDLGGDSIVSLQVVARAASAGVVVTPRQVFDHPTVADLAAASRTVSHTPAAPDVPTGPVPLTPIQRWFFAREEAEPHHSNQAVLLLLHRSFSPAILERAFAALESHHDALRMRFSQDVAGEWTQTCLPVGGAAVVEQVSIAGLGDDRRRAVIAEAADRTQRSLDLSRGPLWRAVLFAGDEATPSRLLFVVHHLVVDGVSWRVLLEDLAAACSSLEGGRLVELPPKTASFRRWSEELGRFAASDGAAEAAAYWRGMAPGTPLPRDRDDANASNTLGEAAAVRTVLDAETTEALLREVPRAYRTQVGDVLLAALALAFRSWTGRNDLVLDLEGHGREDVVGLDVSRTVGWFTAVHPVRLTVPEDDLGTVLKTVKEQLRAVPQRGLPYGVLRYLRDERFDAAPEVAFNYLGQFDASDAGEALFGAAPEPAGATSSPSARRAHLLEINGLVAGGCLRLDWSFAPAVHDRRTIEVLARGFEDALRALVAHCRSGAAGLTPSDVPLARLDQAALDRVIGDGGGVEDVYPLTSMQAGLLFLTVRSPEKALYHEQGTYEFDGPLDVTALRQAWQAVLARHAILRTRFSWEGLEEPLQVVERHVELPWSQEDWSGTPPTEQDRRFEERLASDRARGFDLRRAPVMRLHLVRLGADRHRLLWSFHHALLDGWCVPLVLRDLLEAYGAARNGARVASARPRPYREYIAWLRGRDPHAAEGFWRERLRGVEAFPAVAEVAGRPPRGPAQIGEHSFAVGAATGAALRRAGRRHGLTFNTFVQGAWALLLAQYAGRDEVVFGATTSGRPAALPGVEGMVGLFINTLPLRTTVEPSVTAADWLRRLQAEQVEQREYDYTALADVQRWAGIPAGTALFDTLLAFENYPVDPAVLEKARELKMRRLGIRETTNFPLVVIAASAGEALHFRFHYDRSRFEVTDVQRLEAHLLRLLHGLAASTDAPLGTLRLLDPGDEGQVVTGWNRTATGYPRDATLAALFAEQAAAHAGSVAVSAGSDAVTYAELDRRSNRLAAYLKAQGVGPEVRVGLCAERSIEMVTAMLGIVKAGGAYVPLDPSYPAERLAFMAQDARLGMIVGQSSFLSALPALNVPLFALDGDGDVIQPHPDGPVENGAAADSLAYVIYTSGSTGTPKGVAVPQRAIVRLVRETDYVSLGPSDVVLQASNASFDAATFEVWGALLSGARLRIVTREVSLSPAALAREIQEQGGTTLFLTTALFNQVAQESPEAFAPLRTLLFGGEAVDPRWVGEVLKRGAPTRLLHVYGPTENTTFSTWEHVTAVGESAWTVPIGRPISNSRMLVLDREGRPVPVGVPGELYVGGDGLARGYLDQAERTAERFVPDAYGNEPGARLYRTGDRVRQREDGSLEFLGRLDGQVKIRGFRIEVGEVQAVLAAHPAVREAVVVVDGEGADRRLLAYVVGDGLEPAAFKAWLGTRLPAYAVPAVFVVLAALPLNANGKVDRRGLPKPDARAAAALVPPRDALEETLAAAWRDVLGVERVGVHDNFFDLGGHSLSLMRLHGRLRSVAPRELTVVELFEHPTVAALAERLRQGEATGSAAAAERTEARQAGRERLLQRRSRRQEPS